MMQKRRIIIMVAAILILGVTPFLLYERIFLTVGDFLVVRDQLKPADMIHVIAGPDEQTDYAVQFYQKGYAKKIFFTGGWCTFHNFYHGKHGRERALQAGIPSQAIAVDESPVTSTYSEVVKLKEFIDRSEVPILSVIAVSDPYHMRRARWTYREVLGDKIVVRMAPVSFELSPHKRHWWMDRGSRRMVKDEYMKILYYYARYRFSWGLLKNWLVSLDRN